MGFDPDLVRSVAAAIGAEARAGFNHFGRPSLTCQSPVLVSPSSPAGEPASGLGPGLCMACSIPCVCGC